MNLKSLPDLRFYDYFNGTMHYQKDRSLIAVKELLDLAKRVIEGGNEISIMLGSPFFDSNGIRIFEKDLLVHKYFHHRYYILFKNGCFTAHLDQQGLKHLATPLHLLQLDRDYVVDDDAYFSGDVRKKEDIKNGKQK